MHLNWLALAVPLFLSIMAIEFLVARKKNLPYFQQHQSISNISVGIAERLSDVFISGLFFYLYRYLHSHFGIFYIRPSVTCWILLLLLTDFVWYWYHRLAHEVNVFWAAHVVHHSSEDFNYTVSARITVFQAIIRGGFWCILPILGFSPAMVFSLLMVHGIYPFFVHTRLIGKLGLLEYVFVTPSHHRVHHASNESYLDKNYGDVLIIWDKLFGTFKKEDEPAEYGLTQPLNSYSFLWQHFHFFIELGIAVRQTKGIWNKLRVLFASPAILSKDLRGEAEQMMGIHQRKTKLTQPLNSYVVWQLSISLLLLFLFLLFELYIPTQYQIIFSLLLLLTLINCGAIMEQKRWVFFIEYARLCLAAIMMVLLAPGTYSVSLLVLTAALLLYYFNEINEQYLQLVYRNRQ